MRRGNRGAAYDDGIVYFNTLDAQTVAVDAATGKERWKTRVGDINWADRAHGEPAATSGLEVTHARRSLGTSQSVLTLGTLHINFT